MWLQIHRLDVKNFKCFKEHGTYFDDRRMVLCGANATGKTTLYDAYTWILFGKNSEGKTDFGIRTYDENGNPIRGEDTVVEACFSIGDKIPNEKTFYLKKLYKEKVQRKKGTNEEVFIGNEVEYYINEVRVTAKEYNEFIEKIGDIQKFRLLSEVYYFQNLHWKERRELLIRLINEEEIKKELKKKYGDLFEEVEEKGLDFIKKSLNNSIKDLKERIKNLSIRIDEINQLIPEVSKDEEEIKKEIKEIQKEIDNIQTQKKFFESQNANDIEELNKLLNEKFEIEKQISKIKNEISLKNEEEKRIISNNFKLKESLDRERNILIEKLKELNELLKKKTNEVEEFRNEWKSVSKEEFKSNENILICFNCGQRYPEDKAQEILRNAKNKFDEEKKRKLEEITIRGKRAVAEKDNLTNEINKVEEQIKNIEEGAKTLRLITVNYEFPEEIKELEKRKIEIENKINELSNKKIDSNEYDKEIKKLNDAIIDLNKDLEKINFRNELINKKENLSKELEKDQNLLIELEQKNIKIEEYEYYYNELIEKHVNELFYDDKDIKIKLFKPLINGGTELVCDIYYKGVPINEVNHGHKIVVGLKIIKYLSELFNFYVPIFVDNAEAVNDYNLPIMQNQLILLKVAKEKRIYVGE